MAFMERLELLVAPVARPWHLHRRDAGATSWLFQAALPFGRDHVADLDTTPDAQPRERRETPAVENPAEVATPEDGARRHSARGGVPTERKVWRGLGAALRFLLPFGDRPKRMEASTLEPAVGWIVPVGLAVGLLWVGTFRVAWRIFGETGSLRVMPALAVVLLECTLTGPFLVLGLARTIHVLGGARPLRVPADDTAPLTPAGMLALILTVLSLWVLVVSIPDATTSWASETDPWHFFNFLYPRAILRPLLLAPLWGRWGILLCATVGKTAHDADPQVVSLSRSMSPGRLLRQAILPLALTAVYFSREHNRLLGVIIGLAVFGVSFLACVVMARRGGGQTRPSVFAGGQVAQLAFLGIYRAFWPLIHQ